jgi:hypothetical protein
LGQKLTKAGVAISRSSAPSNRGGQARWAAGALAAYSCSDHRLRMQARAITKFSGHIKLSAVVHVSSCVVIGACV